jgi:hypothetical protein
VCLCFASQKPSKREFFVRARTDLGVKLLISYFPKEYFFTLLYVELDIINDKYNKVIILTYIILSQEVFFLHSCMLKISAGFLVEVQLSVSVQKISVEFLVEVQLSVHFTYIRMLLSRIIQFNILKKPYGKLLFTPCSSSPCAASVFVNIFLTKEEPI